MIFILRLRILSISNIFSYIRFTWKEIRFFPLILIIIYIIILDFHCRFWLRFIWLSRLLIVLKHIIQINHRLFCLIILVILKILLIFYFFSKRSKFSKSLIMRYFFKLLFKILYVLLVLNLNILFTFLFCKQLSKILNKWILVNI